VTLSSAAITGVSGTVTFSTGATMTGPGPFNTGGSSGGDSGSTGPTVTTYTVTFDLDGGNVGGATAAVTKTVNSGASVSSLPAPVKTGFVLNGCFTAKSGA
jgi:hypothetical protein